MKVVAINGSPRKGGNCAQMLEVLGKVLDVHNFKISQLDSAYLDDPIFIRICTRSFKVKADYLVCKLTLVRSTEYLFVIIDLV